MKFPWRFRHNLVGIRAVEGFNQTGFTAEVEVGLTLEAGHLDASRNDGHGGINHVSKDAEGRAGCHEGFGLAGV